MRTLQALVLGRQAVLVRPAPVLVGRALLGGLLGFVLAATQPASPADTTPHVRRGHDELVNYAESQLRPGLRHSTEAAHVLVISDSPSGRADAAMAGNFETVYRNVQTILKAPSTASAPKAAKVRAYLFQTEAQYKSFEQYANPRVAGRTAGMYFPGSGILAFHLEMISEPWLRHVMLHECTHAFLDHGIRGWEHDMPTWLGEGLAEYIGLSLVSGGRIQVGVFTTKTRHESTIGILPSDAYEQLTRGRRAVRRTLKLDTLLKGDPYSFQSEDATKEFYAGCWLLVCYLRDGHEGWSENQFPTLIMEIGAGHSDKETLETIYGVKAQEMEAGFHQYVKDFKLVRGFSPPDKD